MRHCSVSFVDKRGDLRAAHNSLWLFSRGVSDLGSERWGILQYFKSICATKKKRCRLSVFPSLHFQPDSLPKKLWDLENNSSRRFCELVELGNVCVG